MQSSSQTPLGAMAERFRSNPQPTVAPHAENCQCRILDLALETTAQTSLCVCRFSTPNIKWCLLSAYCDPDAVLSRFLHTLSHNIIIFILQVGKLRLREVNWLAILRFSQSKVLHLIPLHQSWSPGWPKLNSATTSNHYKCFLERFHMKGKNLLRMPL